MSDQLIEALLAQASPVLLGQKPAALFTLEFAAARELYALAASRDGLGVEVLRRQGTRGQVLLYHPELLSAALAEKGAVQLLRSHGYPACRLADQLRQLKRRVCLEAEFPHEVGLFLGYPLEDVEGFMRHGGAACRLCGTWKVYGDVAAARARFRRYQLCETQLREYVNRGGDLMKLWQHRAETA